MSIAQQLKSIGLNHSEVAVYLFLLENGVSTPPIVSRGTKIARTNCYSVLQSLKERGLIELQNVRNRKSYFASDPESLLRSWQKRKEAIEQLLPDLRGIYTNQKNKPKIQFYDGIDQIKEIYEKSLSAKEIFAIGSTKQISIILPEFLDYYFNQIKKREIFFNDILTSDSETNGLKAKEILKGYYAFKLLPKNYQDFPTDILIWNNCVALITLKEPFFGTILTNNLFSTTFKSIFQLIKNI